MSDSISTAGGASGSTTDVEHVSVEDSGAPMGSAKEEEAANEEDKMPGSRSDEGGGKEEELDTSGSTSKASEEAEDERDKVPGSQGDKGEGQGEELEPGRKEAEVADKEDKVPASQSGEDGGKEQELDTGDSISKEAEAEDEKAKVPGSPSDEDGGLGEDLEPGRKEEEAEDERDKVPGSQGDKGEGQGEELEPSRKEAEVADKEDKVPASQSDEDGGKEEELDNGDSISKEAEAEDEKAKVPGSPSDKGGGKREDLEPGHKEEEAEDERDKVPGSQGDKGGGQGEELEPSRKEAEVADKEDEVPASQSGEDGGKEEALDTGDSISKEAEAEDEKAKVQGSPSDEDGGLGEDLEPGRKEEEAEDERDKVPGSQGDKDGGQGEELEPSRKEEEVADKEDKVPASQSGEDGGKEEELDTGDSISKGKATDENDKVPGSQSDKGGRKEEELEPGGSISNEHRHPGCRSESSGDEYKDTEESFVDLTAKAEHRSESSGDEYEDTKDSFVDLTAEAVAERGTAVTVEKLLQPTLMEEGLHIRRSGKKSVHKYPYMLLPHSSPEDIGWLRVSEYELDLPYIGLHYLQESKELPSHLLNNPNVIAVIVVSSTNEYWVAVQGFQEKNVTPPIAVVTSETGKKLRDLTTKYDKNVEAKLHTSQDLGLCATQKVPTHESETAGLLGKEIFNGLMINKYDKSGTVCASFPCSYAWVPPIETGGAYPIESMVVSCTKLEEPHVFCYQLKEGDDFHQLSSLFGSCIATLLLVNTENSFQIDSKLLPQAGDKWPVPVLFIKYMDGVTLLKPHDHEGSTEVRVVKITTPEPWNDNVEQESSNQYKEQDQGEKSLLYTISRKMFPPDGPKIASEDKDLFSQIMSEFVRFEQKDIDYTDLDATLSMLIEKYKDTFERDFPFYLILAHHAHITYTKFHSKSKLLQSVITCTEKLHIDVVARTLNGFIARASFALPVGLKHIVSAFYHLEDILFSVMKDSRSEVYSVYETMLWITLYMKFKSSRVPRLNSSKIWMDYFLKDYQYCPLDPRNIEGLRDALSLAKALKLPAEVAFGTAMVGKLLASTPTSVRMFYRQRNAIMTLKPYFNDSNEFMEHILRPMKDCYHLFLGKRSHGFLEKLCTDCTRPEAVAHGLSLLDAIVDTIADKNWERKPFIGFFQEWLLLLLSLVDYPRDMENCLNEFVSKHYTVTRTYQEFIMKEIVALTRKKMRMLTVEQICPLFDVFQFWPYQLIEEYLDGYKISKNIKLSDRCWNNFFGVATSRLDGASKQAVVCRFLLRIAEHYKVSGRGVQFLFDLLNLKIPTLLSVHTDASGNPDDGDQRSVYVFEDDIREFIRRSELKEVLRTGTKDMLNCISNVHTGVQEIVLNAVLKVISPDSKDVQGDAPKPSVKHAIEAAVTILNTDQIWTTREPDVRQKFCLDFMNTCCAQVQVSTTSFTWVMQFPYVIRKAGEMFHHYSQRNSRRDIVLRELPPKVGANTSSSVIKYFTWVQNLHMILFFWKEKLDTQTANYDDIHFYAQNISGIERVATAVSVQSLVVPEGHVSSLKNTYLQQYEKLNLLLIRYVRTDDPEKRWCSLNHILHEYGVEYSPDIHRTLSQYVQFPDEKTSHIEFPCYNPSPSTDGLFHPPSDDIQLKLSKDISLGILCSIVHELSNFLKPIEEFMDLLVYFRLYRGQLFIAYMHHELKEGIHAVQDKESKADVSMSILHEALWKTKMLLQKVLQGTAMYGEITVHGSICLEELDVEKEFEILRACPQLGTFGVKGCESIKSLLKLVQFSGHLQRIKMVCQQYQLNVCLQDPEFLNLLALATTLEKEEERSKLTPSEANKTWEGILQRLGLRDIKCLDLFSKVHDSVDFFKFLEEKQFVGINGEALFRQQFQLITAQLQHEEYEEIVLNHLYVAFTFIAPFMDRTQSFKSLMQAVAQLDMSTGLVQLENVKKNMHLIKLWFSRAEGDTVKNVANELKCIMEAGHYKFAVSGRGECLKLELAFKPSTKLPLEAKQKAEAVTTTEDAGGEAERHVTDEEMLEDKQANMVTWGTEQIVDFVHKLGFLDAEMEANLVHKFQHLNEVALKLLEHFRKLKELGHPKYSSDMFSYTLKCSTQLLTADKEVKETETLLTDWVREVDDLHSTNEWLLFFRVPKLMNLYETLQQSNPPVAAVAQEIGFLFKKDLITREVLQCSIQHVLQDWQCTSQASPMKVVGSFLDQLFSLARISQQSLPKRSSALTQSTSTFTRKSMSCLYNAPDYDQSKLIRLILQIYQCPPQPFEVLHCQSTTTEQELRLFMKRVLIHQRQYLILKVNHLPYQLQELLLQLYLEFKQSHLEDTETTLHFIETAPSVLREVPWLTPKDCKDGPDIDFTTAKMICQQTIQQCGHKDFHVELVYSLPGNGKTHYIKKKMKDLPESQCIVISVNETFSCVSAIKKLCSLPSDAQGCAVFFNFTLLPPEDFDHDKEKEHYQELRQNIGWFFFDLLVLGYIEDPTTGVSFHFPSSLSWTVYVEVPSRDQYGNPEEFLKRFCEDVPALALLGSPILIESDSSYDIDDDVQLICKYLRAYDTGEINRLYRECVTCGELGKYLCMDCKMYFCGLHVITWLMNKPSCGRCGKLTSEILEPTERRTLEVVKFSQDDDLDPFECTELLRKHMPQHVKNSKVSQKMFIQYMKRRCIFLDNLPHFNYNTGIGESSDGSVPGDLQYTDTSKLGSTLMEAMLKEVSHFCNPEIKTTWSNKSHQQLIYDFKDGGASIGLISLLPDDLPEEDKEKFLQIGVKIPSMRELYSRSLLDAYISRALGVPLKDGRLSPIDEKHYVLTLDYSLKMINIHEHHECGISVVIEGETGVGKTALVEMLSQLWNSAWHDQWTRLKGTIIDMIRRVLGEVSLDSFDGSKYTECMEALHTLENGIDVHEETLDVICQLPHKEKRLYIKLNELLLKLKGDPLLALLDLDLQDNLLDEAFHAISLAKEVQKVDSLVQHLDSSDGTSHTTSDVYSLEGSEVTHECDTFDVMAVPDHCDGGNLIMEVPTESMEQVLDAEVPAAGIEYSLQEPDAAMELMVPISSFEMEPGLQKPDAAMELISMVPVSFSEMEPGLQELNTDDSKATAHLLQMIICSKMKSTFHKLNVHSALQPEDVKGFFDTVFSQAKRIHKAFSTSELAKTRSITVPYVTAYLDEINTATCLGLLKEIIIDRTIDGEPIPQNVFIIAACNPHRGDSLAVHDNSASELWMKGSYYVRKLHPTFQFILWDYGSLDEYQEQEYVNAKMEMITDVGSLKCMALANLIVKSQQKMREYAVDQLKKLGISEKSARKSAQSCVSQRDIQRLFTFYQWLMRTYISFNPHEETVDKHAHRAVLVALAIVYYMRLSSEYRGKYRLFLENSIMKDGITFAGAFTNELTWYIEHVNLPPGIAKTQALKENVFATIACTVTHTPLIIVGHPGSSKTLSFNIAVANLKGKESGVGIFRKTDVFPSLDPHFYQCSRRTTSNEIEKVFKRAINRQRSLEKIPLHVYCVVFMDEAGLPENKLESLKALHYHLDKQEVSFVAISNHILDAAKTNRAVSLFRPKATEKELHELATGCIVQAGQTLTDIDRTLVKQFCTSYSELQTHEEFKKLFGLRDFIHFIIFLRRKRKEFLGQHLIRQSLQRNFNGSNRFDEVCKIFKVEVHHTKLRHCSILDILKDSLQDHAKSETDAVHSSIQSEVRYKLIIDPSEDDSLVRLLFMYGVLEEKKTRLYICSDFAGESQLRVNTIAQIRHSVSAGHTVLMCQTDEIHESFYDLFNQNFRSIELPDDVRYYTNIAIGAHSKPCRVHPSFQCVVVIKKSEVENTPAPFLNRFEKYYLTHEGLLETIVRDLPPCLQILLKAAHDKAAEFIQVVNDDESNIYGYSQDTLHSLMLMLLPRGKQSYEPLTYQQHCIDDSEPDDSEPDDSEPEDMKVTLLKYLIQSLRKNVGFCIPPYSKVELMADVANIFPLVFQYREFESLMSEIKHDSLIAAVNDALDVLYNGPAPNETDGRIEIYVDSCMVISVLTQWLVSYLCKSLMQLMTPEAIIHHNEEIPTFYLQQYQKFQDHFSLRELVERQLELLKHTCDNAICPTKLLCFTRSSPLISQLSADFPSVFATESTLDFLREHVFGHLERLMMCKVTSRHSQSKLEKLLTDFMNADASLLFLVVSMQETTRKMVNHLRIMIEEKERQFQNKEKLFILLLHFPSVMFFDHCYVSLYLQGWSHHYLDTTAHGTLTTKGVKAVVDVKQWFEHCCFPEPECSSADEHQMSEILEKSILPEAIPIISSRVVFTSSEDGVFSQPMNASDRSDAIKKVLDSGLGRVLCSRFSAYWQPRVMVQHMKEVTRFMYTHESTLNVTDSIHTIVRSKFFDFLVYMFKNMDCTLDILLDDASSDEVKVLYLHLLEVIPVPDLSQLQILSETTQPESRQGRTVYFPKFPFFKNISDTVEKAIDECREKVNQKTNILQEPAETASVTASVLKGQKRNWQQMETLYLDAVKEKIDSKEGCVGLAVHDIDADESGDLWKRYCEDFGYHNLHLKSRASTLTQDILKAYFGTLDTTDTLTCLVSLHVRVRVCQLDLTKLVRLLNPFSRVHEEMETLVPKTDPVVAVLTPIEPGSKSIIPGLATFSVHTLFNSICYVSTPSSDPSESDVNQWCTSYCDMISMPVLEEDIMSNLTPEVEAQLNLMHATYLVMECCCDSSSLRGCEVFRALYSMYFDDNSKHNGLRPNLSDVASVAMKSLKKSTWIISFLERLFAYFFSVHRTSFSEEDCWWFMEVANEQHELQSLSGQSNLPTDENPQKLSIPVNVLKLYLSRILQASEEGILQLYISKRREMVGKVLISQKDLGTSGPYIPQFYQLRNHLHTSYCATSENAMMQQPLAHLYFVTVLEHLQTKGNRALHLVQLAQRITKTCNEDETTEYATPLLNIEKQAVIQVLIHQVASYFDPKDPMKKHGLFNNRLINAVNPLLNDESMGGSDSTVSGHGMVLALNLQRQLQSSSKLLQFLQDDHSFVKDIPCLKPLQSLIKVKPQNVAHLFPFIGPEEKTSELGHFYQEIFETMVEVHNQKASTESVDALVELASKSCKSSTEKMQLTAAPDSMSISKKMAFRMLLWLCAYHKFFCVRKNHSKILADVILNNLGEHLESNFIGLLYSFIYPSSMICKPEVPPDLDESAPKFEVTGDNRVIPVEREGEKKDPVFELFNPPSDTSQDMSDIQLCHAIANMVAAAVASEPFSNHIWCHIFAADKLKGTRITGFMYDSEIKEGRLYDCGVELTFDGRYGRPDYIPHATRGTLSLHSLYLILWANFAAFSMALLTQQDAQQKISGPVISSWQPIRHYCVSQLRALWLHMGNNLKLSLEEQSFFIMRCMLQLLELENSPDFQKQSVFKDLQELDDYETMWHSDIFAPTYADIHEQFAEYCQLWQNALFQDLSYLDARYPHFPTMDEFSQALLSSTNIGNPTQNELYVLSQFALEYPRLQAGGVLLPDLIALYQWIHSELAFLVTRNYAENNTIEEVLTKADKRFTGLNITDLYERVKVGYNTYVKVVGHSIGGGACGNARRGGKVLQIDDRTKLLHFLSSSDEEEGNDWLYLVIDDIVNFHNSFLDKVAHAVWKSPQLVDLKQYFPEKSMDDSVYPAEVNASTCIVGTQQSLHGIDEHLQLVRSRYLQAAETHISLAHVHRKSFDFEQLQKDVTRIYLMGKPTIHSPSEHLRVPFKFMMQPVHTVALDVSDFDLSTISECMRSHQIYTCKVNDHGSLLKELECEFHSANYHTLVEVAGGLRTTTQYLMKQLDPPGNGEPGNGEPGNGEALKDQTVPIFLLSVYKRKEAKEEDIMYEIGIRSLSDPQMSCLLKLKLPYLYSTLELFVQWIKDGVYDFHQLPLVMKKHLEPEDEKKLRELSTTDASMGKVSVYKGTDAQLMADLHDLTDALVHCQSYLSKAVTEKPEIMERPIIPFLKEMGTFGTMEELSTVIPDSVLCQHYVALRVAIRRQVSGLECKVPKKCAQTQQRWKPFVDIWEENKLKHLKDAAVSFDYNPQFQFDVVTGLYGYQHGFEEEDEFVFIQKEREEKLDDPSGDRSQPSGNPAQPGVPTEKQLENAATELTADEVSEYLRSIKMEQYSKAFAANDIDGGLMWALKDGDLSDIGVAVGFHRRKILTKFKPFLLGKLSS